MVVPEGTTRKELLRELLREILSEVAAHPEKAFSAAELLERSGLRKPAEALKRNARCRAQIGLFTGPTPPNDAAIVWGDGPIKCYAVPNADYVERMREVAQALMYPTS